jgi:hypothetical protein
MKKRGHLVGRDGSVSLEDFDAAKEKAEELLESFVKGKDKEQEKKMRRYWPMREGKFALTMGASGDMCIMIYTSVPM